ncbi:MULTISPECIES: ABC transporter permease [Actinoalloteichus]|uniref:ABC-type antimicrobial peptide transport system, permease component n=1 Tax=Actinoalloteichus fjordicus TaxID=1612552 RepID=A0AAC9LEH8_9PSEU|nr:MULTISPECIES: ABC transporter permease [Actinoalloteichus]APU16186.1 ABC-type antimicrobial peptide transport system, permease component [Actinoalloteichus fjordicus]APU22248.1 ABC-type antimicrobial peptide transport system, permease component [Actinoalloteichus sp. GBA129-24]
MIGTSGRLRSSLIIGGQGIRARKLRTFLSMVSLFLGVLAVVAVQAGAEIAQRAMLADIELLEGVDGTTRVYLPRHESSTGIAQDLLAGRDDAVAVSSESAIIGEPGVAPINPGATPLDMPGSYGGMTYCDASGCYDEPDPNAGLPTGQAIELMLTSLSGDLTTFRPFRPISGDWLDFEGEPSFAPRIVLNEHAAEGFEMHDIPGEMRVPSATANLTPQIVGVVDDGGWGPAAYVRADEMFNWQPTGDDAAGTEPGNVEVYLSPAAADVEQLLRSRLSAAGANTDEMGSWVITSRADAEDQLAMMQMVFLGLAALVLLIGIAGILNVGLATVGERIEEFALRRAVGTSRMLLAGIVLAETLLTGLITAAAAIGVGAVGIQAISMIMGGSNPALADLAFPWQAGVSGVVAGLIAGILGGLIPAIRAARIPIATVMRA